MNQVMPAKTLDLKAPKSINSSKKKDKSEDFRKELDEKEKKASDRDHLSAAHQNNLEKRDSVKKNAEASKEALRSQSQEQKGIEKAGSVQTGTVVTAESAVTAPSAEDVQQQAAVAAEGAVVQATTEAAGDLQSAQIETLQKMQATQLGQAGGISLEGMTLVNPEAVQLQMMQPETTDASAIITTENSAAMNAVAGIEGKSLDADAKGSEGDLSDLQSNSLNDSLNSALQAHTKDKGVNFEAVMKAATAAPTDGADAANMDNMIQSARTLLRDGGGEMKVVLTPEGLGTVDLKVAVKGTEVSIEIMAQDQNVKKMFEDGIADIRSALEVQNLKVDNFKVDISQRSELASGDQQQQDTMNREFARDFMNQFRGERQGMRNQAMGYDMERSPNFSKSPEGLRPASSTAAGNGRLNLIA